MTLLSDVDVSGTKYAYSNRIPMGTSATPAGSEVKDCTFADSFELNVGNLISVTFAYANTYGDGSTTYPKLLINGTRYPVKQPVGGYASSGAWANGQAVTFMFDGTNLVLLTVPVVDTVAAGNMNSVTSNAVYNALTLKNPTIVGQISSNDNVQYFRIKDFVSDQRNQQNVLYVLQSRGGEIVIVNVGQDDDTYKVKAKRLLNVYTKINGLSYSGNDLYIQINGYSNITTITKLCGNYDAIPTILIATETEYNSATSIPIEE